MLLLDDGPSYPDHVKVDADGVATTTQLTRTTAPLPARFSGPARPGAEDGPPWATLVFGLETGRWSMRERFLEAMRADAQRGLPLTRGGDALGAAFSVLFGGRGATADTPGFLAWLQAAHDAEPASLKHELVRGLGARESSQGGVTSVSFGLETGHVPADHVEALYRFAALVPGLEDVHFTQDHHDERYTLHAWRRGERISAPAEDQGDFTDVWSCAALVNALHRGPRVALRVEDEGVLAMSGTRPQLRALRRRRE